ncbi:MAG: putative NTPase, partial [Rickettsiaceae bacterium]|nr:putative NTPase [Rickettsiaceae bacterium]
DGYDEIIHKYRCGDVIIDRVIDGAITIKNSDARIIMTSRPNAIDYDTKEKFDAEIENIGLKKENVYKYVDKFAFKEGVEKSQALSQFIKSHKRFETMVQIPINLFLVCWLFDNGGLDKKKVETSTDLYQQITISLMRRYLEKFDERYSKEKTINLYPEQIEHKCTEVCLALEQIAYLGVKAKTAILNENLIKQVMLGKIDNSDTILVDIKELGLMTAIGEGAQLIEKDYAFIHLTFRDYFAARYIVRILRSDDISKIKEICIFLNENKYDPAYEQVFLFVSGLVVSEFGNAQAIEYFWNIILNGRCDLNIKTQVQLAINCLEEGKCSNQIVGINEFKGIIKSEQLLKFDWFVDSLYRNVQVLNSLGLADTIVDMVSKPTSGLHAEPKTLKLLEKLEINDLKLKKKIRIALIPLLENRANFRAAEIIGKLNITDSKVELEEPLVTAILTLLKVRKDSYYLGSAVGELLKLMRIPLSSRAQKQIAEGIINLINEPAIKTRINAVSALEGLIITDPELLDLLAAKLISLLEDDSPALSFNIKDLLAILSKLDAKMKNIIAEYFISLLDKEDYFIRDRAISILGSIRPKDCDTQVSIAKKLILLLQSVNTNMYEVTPALKGLGIEDLEVKKALISELISLLHCDNPNFLVEQGLEALNINKGELLEEIIPTLNRLLKSSNEKKQIRGVKLSLKLNIANPDTREVMTSVLIKLLSSSEQDRQFEAVRLLLRLNISDPKEHNKILKAIVKTLITLLTKDKEARLDAAQRLSSLELIKDEQEKIHAAIIKSLISLLKVQDTNIRIRAAMILLKLNVTGAKRQKKIHAAIIKAFIPLPKNRWPIEWGLISLKELLSQWNRDNLELCKALTSALISLLEKSYGAKIRIEVLENIRIEVADLLVTLNTVVLEDQKILLNTLDSLLESKDRERRCKAAKMLIDSRIDFKSIAEFNIEEKVALALIPCLKSRSIWIYQGYEAAEVLVNLSNISSPEIQQKLIKELILLYKEDHMSYRFNGILKKLKFAKDKVVEELLSMATDNTPHAKGIDASIFNILRQLSKDDLELKSKIVNTLLEVLGDTHMQAEVIRELSSLDIADNVELQRAVILKLLSMLEMKQNSSVLEDIHYYRIPHALLK